MKKTRANKSALELKLAKIRVLSGSNLGGVVGGLKLPDTKVPDGTDCIESACPNGTCDGSKVVTG